MSQALRCNAAGALLLHAAIKACTVNCLMARGCQLPLNIMECRTYVNLPADSSCTFPPLMLFSFGCWIDIGPVTLWLTGLGFNMCRLLCAEQQTRCASISVQCQGSRHGPAQQSSCLYVTSHPRPCLRLPNALSIQHLIEAHDALLKLVQRRQLVERACHVRQRSC